MTCNFSWCLVTFVVGNLPDNGNNLNFNSFETVLEGLSKITFVEWIGSKAQSCTDPRDSKRGEE